MIGADLTSRTTRLLVGTLEWAVVFFQGVSLLVSAVYDPYPTWARAVMLGLSAVHFATVPVLARLARPVSRGGKGLLIGVALAILIPALAAVLASPGTYGESMLCVPMCNYAAGPLLVAAFYPWVSARRAHLRPGFEAGLLLVFLLQPVVLIAVVNPPLRTDHAAVVFLSFAWNFTGYVLGKAIGKMCSTGNYSTGCQRAEDSRAKVKHPNSRHDQQRRRDCRLVDPLFYGWTLRHSHDLHLKAPDALAKGGSGSARDVGSACCLSSRSRRTSLAA